MLVCVCDITKLAVTQVREGILHSCSWKHGPPCLRIPLKKVRVLQWEEQSGEPGHPPACSCAEALHFLYSRASSWLKTTTMQRSDPQGRGPDSLVPGDLNSGQWTQACQRPSLWYSSSQVPPHEAMGCPHLEITPSLLDLVGSQNFLPKDPKPIPRAHTGLFCGYVLLL